MQEQYCREVRLSACALDPNGLERLRQIFEKRTTPPEPPLEEPLPKLPPTVSPADDLLAYEAVITQTRRAINRQRQAQQTLALESRPWITYLLRHNDTKSTELWETQSREAPSGQTVAIRIASSLTFTQGHFTITLGDWSASRNMDGTPDTTWNRLAVCSDDKDWTMAVAQDLEREIATCSRKWYDIVRSAWFSIGFFAVVAILLMTRGQIWETGSAAQVLTISIASAGIVALVCYIIMQVSFPIFEYTGSGLQPQSRLVRAVVTFALLALVGWMLARGFDFVVSG